MLDASVNGTFDITSFGMSASSVFLSIRMNTNMNTANKKRSKIVIYNPHPHAVDWFRAYISDTSEIEIMATPV